jgi:hypothetical protein
MAIVKRPPTPAQNTKSVDDFISGAPDAVASAPAVTATPAAAAEAPAPRSRVMKGNQAQITFTLPLELLEKVNKAADQLSLSRAGFMKMAISRAVESEGV